MQYYEPGFKILLRKTQVQYFAGCKILYDTGIGNFTVVLVQIEVACLLQLEDIGNIFIRVRKSIYE